MTDEDTDDDNDRMNRADRLREMREGRRRGRSEDADDTGTDGDTSTDDASGDTDPDSDSEVRDVPSPSGSAGRGSAATADDEPAATSTADESADGGDDTDSDVRDVPSPTGSAGGDSTATADDGSADASTGTDDAVEESEFEFDDREKEAAHAEKAEKTGVEGANDGASPESQSDVAGTVSSTDAASAVETLNSGSTFAIPEQATTVTEDTDTTLDSAEQSVAAARAAASRGTTHVGARTRVLEFELGDERFCLDIDYIEEIVELENMTRVPNSPSFVEGVVDLRGQVTTIINPKDALEVDEETNGELIIVFDSEEVGDQGHLGWVVDEVRQVTPVSDDEVNDSPDEDAEYINGIINREDEEDFVVWTTPELALNSS